jgi:hypothetical protein
MSRATCSSAISTGKQGGVVSHFQADGEIRRASAYIAITGVRPVLAILRSGFISIAVIELVRF